MAFKRAVLHTLYRADLYNEHIIRKSKRKLEKSNMDMCLGFNEIVLYEAARKRLKSLPSGLSHPQNHFYDKHNQRRFMQSIGADLPQQLFSGMIDGVKQLEIGDYFLKPSKGSSAKGAIPISIKRNQVTVKGEIFSLEEFPIWYYQKFSRSEVIVEEKLEDRFFDSLVDYKAYCFQGGGVDHILCMQREDIVTGASFSPQGERLNTGKYATSEMTLDVPKVAIREIASIAQELFKKIPLSFARLDFYYSNSGVFLGEVTPIPGDSGDFSKQWNYLMGKKWVEARAILPQCVESMAGYPYFEENKLEWF